MADDVYVGKGWEKKFDNGGSVISVSLNLEELKKLGVDNYGNVRVVVGERRSPDEKSRATHWVKVDRWYYDKQG